VLGHPVIDVVVVGGGIVGAACAEACADTGLRVAIVEPGIVGGGTTAAGMGHLTVMDDSPAQLALTRLSVDLWNERSRDLPATVEFHACGTLWVAADGEEMAEVRRKRSVYGDRSRVLDARELAEAEPNLRPGLAGALLVKCDSVVYPPTAARHFARRATIVAGTAAAIRDGAVVLANGTTLSCAAVVNACGVRAPELTPGLDIQPRKGHLLITDRHPGFLRHQLVELGYLKSAHGSRGDSVAFNLQPRVTGQILIGSSRQFGTLEPRVESRMLAWMLGRAVEYAPALARLTSIRAWTGFRPCTPDNLPYIGLAPGARSVYVAAGHEGLGITTSLGTARLIADMILGRESPIPREPYAPGRPSKEVAHG
jgi:glycine/D-amino acid oxidase-like deaminating enzyme